MRIILDQEKCSNCLLCLQVPSVFQSCENSVTIVDPFVKQETIESSRKAVRVCPTKALALLDN
jgi:ferredoxin